MPWFKTGDACKTTYKFGKTLGTGSFATVKIGTRIADSPESEDRGKKGSKWAIKIINKKNLEKEDKDALESEVKIMETVSHPNIIRLNEVFDSPAHFYMVMEICSGGELFDRIVEREKYTEKDAADVVSKVADALAYCHNMEPSIVHRDLKPENLLLTSTEMDADVKIADFGLAKILNDDTLMQTACGTPGYVAPEILEVQPYDKQVDAWSLGVITYILLCGFPPFYDDNNAQLFASIKSGNYEFPEPYWNDVSQDAKEFINDMLVVKPEGRISCEQVKDHKWIQNTLKEEHKCEALDMNAMTQFNARRKFKMAGQKIKLGIKMAGAMSK